MLRSVARSSMDAETVDKDESAEETDAMHPNWRQLQEINGRTIYECQEAVDAETVDKDDLIEELIEAETQTQNDNVQTVQSLYIADKEGLVWMVLCIVFIVLFGVALLAVVFLGSFVWSKRRDEFVSTVGWDKDDDDDNKPDDLSKHQYLASKSQVFAAGDNVLNRI